MAGLDPAIHLSRNPRWMRGSSPRMTTEIVARAVRVLPDPNFQTATSLLSRERFSAGVFRLPFSFCSQKRERSAARRIGIERAPAKEHVPVFAKTSSPYGAPPRCFVTVGPLYVADLPWLLPHGPRTATRTEDSIRGSLVSREAFSTRLPGAWLARPCTRDHRSPSTLSRSAERPSANGDESAI